MKQLRRLRPTPAMVVACIALTVALGGTSVAAINALPRNSVGAKQLKKNAVTNPKIKANAVTGAKVANDSITGADVNEASLGTVPSATNAANATNATNATNAGNATNLGGQPASAYAPSTVVRFVSVSGTGVVDAAHSRGVAQANVTHPSTGQICIDGLSPAPMGATISHLFGGTFQSQIFIQPGPSGASVCTGKQIGIATYDSSNAASNEPVIVAIY